MANWPIHAARIWLRPLWDRMKAKLLSHCVIHTDETVEQVLHESGKKAKTDSRACRYTARERFAGQHSLFEYHQPTRHGNHAAQFLGDYAGYLVCDGFDGYNKVKSVNI